MLTDKLHQAYSPQKQDRGIDTLPLWDGAEIERTFSPCMPLGRLIFAGGNNFDG